LGKGHWVGPVFFQIDQQFLWDGKSIKQAPKWGNKKNALLAIGPGFAGMRSLSMFKMKRLPL